MRLTRLDHIRYYYTSSIFQRYTLSWTQRGASRRKVFHYAVVVALGRTIRHRSNPFHIPGIARTVYLKFTLSGVAVDQRSFTHTRAHAGLKQKRGNRLAASSLLMQEEKADDDARHNAVPALFRNRRFPNLCATSPRQRRRMIMQAICRENRTCGRSRAVVSSGFDFLPCSGVHV